VPTPGKFRLPDGAAPDADAVPAVAEPSKPEGA